MTEVKPTFVYFETNFILEIAYRRDAYGCCEEILELRDRLPLRFVLPAFCVVESIYSAGGRQAKRKDMTGSLNKEARELRRGPMPDGAYESMTATEAFLASSIEVEAKGLQETIQRLTSLAELIEINHAMLERARTLRETTSLSVPDSGVLASVLRHLEENGVRRAVFLNRDKGFADPEVKRLLQDRGCQLIPQFESGLERLRAGS